MTSQTDYDLKARKCVYFSLFPCVCWIWNMHIEKYFVGSIQWRYFVLSTQPILWLTCNRIDVKINMRADSQNKIRKKREKKRLTNFGELFLDHSFVFEHPFKLPAEWKRPKKKTKKTHTPNTTRNIYGHTQHDLYLNKIHDRLTTTTKTENCMYTQAP